jgi:hypothetical protein
MNGRFGVDFNSVCRLAAARVRSVRRRALWKDERGMSLVFALFGLVTLTILGLGLTGIGMTSLTVANNEAENSEALAIADAGISHAKRLLLWQDWMSFDQFLQDGDGNGCTGDELSGPPINGTGGYPAALPDYPTALTDFIASKASGGRPFGVGKYYVSVCDDASTDLDKNTGLIDSNINHDANKKVLLRSTGLGRNGSTATIESVIGAVNMPAIFVNGNVDISGNAWADGDNGVVYANGSLDISGNPCSTQYFMTTGGSTGATNAGGGTSCTTTQAEVKTYAQPLPVPSYKPSDFEQYATFKLDIDGIVYTRASSSSPWVAQTDASVAANKTAVTNLIGSAWNYQKGASQKDWKIDTGTGTAAEQIKPGTYYIAGTNLEIGASPGTAADPVVVTLLVDGWADISGSPTMKPYLTLDWFGGIGIIAGTDIEMTGSNSGNYKGLYYAHDQISLAGTPTLNGQVIAANLADPPYPATGSNSVNKVPYSGAMQIGGTVHITYDSGGMAGLSQLSWRECRGADPDNPCGTP